KLRLQPFVRRERQTLAVLVELAIDLVCQLAVHIGYFVVHHAAQTLTEHFGQVAAYLADPPYAIMCQFHMRIVDVRLELDVRWYFKDVHLELNCSSKFQLACRLSLSADTDNLHISRPLTEPARHF